MNLTALRCQCLRPLQPAVTHIKSWLLPSVTHTRPDRHYPAELDNSPLTITLQNRQGTKELPKWPTLKNRYKTIKKHFIPETKKLIQQGKDNFNNMPIPELEHGMYEVAFRFDTPEAISQWTTSGDWAYTNGSSTANFTLSKNRTGLFTGTIDTTVPQDGKTTFAGWTNITSKRPMKPFFKETHYDWTPFNCLLVRFRGDGRAYRLVLGCDFHFDVNWLKRWQYPLYTKGGPYWQVAKIPFSKFYLTGKGKMSDNPDNIPLRIINTVGFTLHDRVAGPFYLEIDSIALMHDANVSGVHAYELYKTKHVVR